VRKFDGSTCVDAGLSSIKKKTGNASNATAAASSAVPTTTRPPTLRHVKQNSLFSGLRSDSGELDSRDNSEEEEEEEEEDDDEDGAVYVQQALISFLPVPFTIDQYSLSAPRSSGWSVSVDASRESLLGKTVASVNGLRERDDIALFEDPQPFLIAFAWKFKRSISASTSITAKFTLEYSSSISSKWAPLRSTFSFTDDGLLSSTVGEIIAVPQGSSYPGSGKN
jgi:hypothetical protein